MDCTIQVAGGLIDVAGGRMLPSGKEQLLRKAKTLEQSEDIL